jgi:membrane-associated phospholipid phosphatase
MTIIRTFFLATSLSLVCAGSPAFAQAVPGDPIPALDTSSAFKDLFGPLGGDLKGVVTTPQNLVIFGVGTAGALTANHFDARVATTPWPNAMKSGFAPAQYVGDSWIQMGGAIAVYSIGRAAGQSRVAQVGAELFRAQIVAETYTQALKFTTSRTRPDGTSLSFPSGHTSSMFATATVLQSEFGWKVGLPAFAAASWVGASRIEKHRHYLSDVIAGATIGMLSGRSVTVGTGKARFAVGPMAAPGGVGVSFTRVSDR